MATYPELKITSPSQLPLLRENVAFTVRLVSEGGKPTFTFSLLSGLLPLGLTISANGMISGTPTSAGIYNFSVRVTDSDGVSADRTYLGIVMPPDPSLPSPIEIEMVLEKWVHTPGINVVQASLVPKQSFSGLVRATGALYLQILSDDGVPLEDFTSVIITIVPQDL